MRKGTSSRSTCLEPNRRFLEILRTEAWPVCAPYERIKKWLEVFDASSFGEKLRAAKFAGMVAQNARESMEDPSLSRGEVLWVLFAIDLKALRVTTLFVDCVAIQTRNPSPRFTACLDRTPPFELA